MHSHLLRLSIALPRRTLDVATDIDVDADVDVQPQTQTTQINTNMGVVAGWDTKYRQGLRQKGGGGRREQCEQSGIKYIFNLETSYYIS